jgi:hypothetical protein
MYALPSCSHSWILRALAFLCSQPLSPNIRVVTMGNQLAALCDLQGSNLVFLGVYARGNQCPPWTSVWIHCRHSWYTRVQVACRIHSLKLSHIEPTQKEQTNIHVFS